MLDLVVVEGLVDLVVIEGLVDLVVVEAGRVGGGEGVVTQCGTLNSWWWIV